MDGANLKALAENKFRSFNLTCWRFHFSCQVLHETGSFGHHFASTVGRLHEGMESERQQQQRTRTVETHLPATRHFRERNVSAGVLLLGESVQKHRRNGCGGGVPYDVMWGEI